MEGESGAWVLMAFALVVLAVNLVYPRSLGVKICALLFLFFATCLHSSNQLNNVERTFNVLERYGPHDEAPVETGYPWIQPLSSRVDRAFFDMWLGLSLGLVFALLPSDSLSRAYARLRRGETAPAARHGRGIFDRAAVATAVVSFFAFGAAEAWVYLGISKPIGLSFPLLVGLIVTAPVAVLAFIISLLIYADRDSRSRADAPPKTA